MAKYQKRVRREYTVRGRGVCWVVETPSVQSQNGNDLPAYVPCPSTFQICGLAQMSLLHVLISSAIK